MTSLFSPDKSSHAAMLASPSAFFASPPAFTPCLLLGDMQSPFGMPAAQLHSPQANAGPTLRFQPHSTMTTGEIGGAFNFAAGTTQHFNVDIALPRTQSQLRPLQLAHPLLPHHNPELLDGFLLDGGSPMSPLASFAAQPTVSSGSRKRKSASPPSAVSPSAASADECDGELVHSASKKSKKHGKSLIDSRNASPIKDAQAGHTSPLLELLQQSNQTAAPAVAKNKKELRRQKAALKLQRLEASIARLTEQVSATRAHELQATELARQMAAQAAHAAQLANQHLAQRDSEMGMVESFFAEEAAASLPPLSPLSASASSANGGSGSGSDSAPSSALRIAVSSSSSSASVSDGGDLSECTTPTLRDRRLLANASPVESLDEAIDAALASAQQQQKQEQSHAGAPCRAQVEHLVALQWEEKARHLRTMQHALHSLEEEVQSPPMDSWIGCADTALQFVSSAAAAGGHDDDADCFEVRAALEQMRADQSRDQVSSLDLHESINEFTSVLIAKSRSQHCTFIVRV